MLCREEIMEEQEVLEMTKPFPTAGSKTRISKFLMANMTEHKVYVEPFAGSASLFFVKDESEKEVLNDLNLGVVSTYKELKSNAEGLVQYLKGKKWSVSKVRFKSILEWKPLRRRDQAYRHLYLAWNSFSGVGLRPRLTDAVKFDSRARTLIRSGERLKNTVITREDGLACIKKWDSENTFFYIDPPYPEAGIKLYAHDKFAYDINEFATALGKLKGKFILSLNDLPENIKAFKGFHVYRISTGYGETGLTAGNSKEYKEILVSNYPLPNLKSQRGSAIKSVSSINTGESYVSENISPSDVSSLREKMAGLEHDRWSRWMNYLFSQGEDKEDGSFVIPPDKVERWKRQAKTDYGNLEEGEKDSDRKEVDKTLSLLEDEGVSLHVVSYHKNGNDETEE
jgi:DNA adenine methylase